MDEGASSKNSLCRPPMPHGAAAGSFRERVQQFIYFKCSSQRSNLSKERSRGSKCSVVLLVQRSGVCIGGFLLCPYFGYKYSRMLLSMLCHLGVRR